MNRFAASILIAIAIFAFGSLFAGAAYLEWPLAGGLPLGNALVAIGLCAASGASLGMSKPNSVAKRLSAVSLIMSIAWFPVSVAMAGNLALNFSNDMGTLWIYLSLTTFASALVALIWAIVRTLLVSLANTRPEASN